MGLFLCEVVGSSGAPQRERENMGCLGGWMLGYWGLVCMPAAPSVALVALSHHRSARTAPRSRLRLVRHLRHLCICLSASSCAIVATLAVTINIPSSLPWHMPLASPNLPSLGAHCRNSFSDALPRAPSIGACALSNGVSLSSTAASMHHPRRTQRPFRVIPHLRMVVVVASSPAGSHPDKPLGGENLAFATSNGISTPGRRQRLG